MIPAKWEDMLPMVEGFEYSPKGLLVAIGGCTTDSNDPSGLLKLDAPNSHGI